MPADKLSRLNGARVSWLNDRANEGIFTTDEQLVVQSWNAWMVRATGQTAEAVVGRHLFEVRPEITARGLGRYYENALAGQSGLLAHRFHGHLLTIATAHGEMPQSCRVAPLLHDETIIGTITVIEDVTERVNSEGELRRQVVVAEDARIAAEKALRAKDEFLATLSHELRTPLNAVLGWTNILRSGHHDADMLRRALEVIERNAVAQARLIDDMLDMARIVTGKIRLEWSVIDLVQTAHAAADAIRPSASAKRIRIDLQSDPGPKLINGDAERLQQVIWNLLSNAVKFTPSGGRITMALREQSDSVSLTVTDTGRGISPEFLPYVFDRFRQANSSTNRTEGGLGLGLALVRQLVDLHGGTVAVSSAGVEQGASFTITFPSMPLPEDAGGPSAAAIDSQLLAGQRVLIVDDDSDWREALSTGLEARGAQVESAGTARDTAMRLTGGAEPITVLIVDIGLPGEDGYALIERIRRLPGDAALTPAIAVTAYAGPEHERRALTSGFDAFRAKPVRLEDVAAAVVTVTRSNDAARSNPASPNSSVS